MPRIPTLEGPYIVNCLAAQEAHTPHTLQEYAFGLHPFLLLPFEHTQQTNDSSIDLQLLLHGARRYASHEDSLVIRERGGLLQPANYKVS
jgi:hypothetical protein